MSFVCTGLMLQKSVADVTRVQTALMALGLITDEQCALIDYNMGATVGGCSKDNNKCDGSSMQFDKNHGRGHKCLYFSKKNTWNCAATECVDNYVMPLVFEQSDVNHENGLILGWCYSRAQAQGKCTGTCSGTCGGECKPKYISYSEANKKLKSGALQMTSGEAFEGCYCDVPDDDSACKTEECYWRGSIFVQCSGDDIKEISGAKVKVDSKTISENELIKLIQNEYKTQIENQCAASSFGAGGVDWSFKAGNDSDVWGNGSTTGETFKASGKGDGDKNSGKKTGDIKGAFNRLSEFFKKIDSDRSVWKNADGSFNGVRLASDLTAGVVLGTVGGVVSGVLIKKAQIEKGFDALNCSVGGQKIADWGDEFTVGLRRY